MPHTACRRRGYGYQPDGTTIVPAEAAIIAEAATRALAGELVRSIARDLNQRAVPSATGGQWSAPEALRTPSTSGRISGRREYHGQITHSEPWLSTITPGQSDQLRVLLARRRFSTRASSRRYLLSGILTCAVRGVWPVRPGSSEGPPLRSA